MKRSGLRSDPEATRDWQQRSRVPLRQDPAKGLKRSGLASRPRVRPVPPRSPGRAAPADSLAAALAVAFKAKRPARTQRCFKCGARAHHWHHWVPAEHMRVWMRGLAREMGWGPREVRKRLRAWLRDERNLAAVCTGCHGNTSTVHAEFHLALVPSSAFEFARELDDELEDAGRPREAFVRLERSYRT
jgi:hypothetical protein